MVNRTVVPYGYVYLIRNKVNGLVYIGATTSTIETRWKGHIASSISNFHSMLIASEIKKYGPESFEISKIKTCFSPEQLKDSETYFINHYQSYMSDNGYNKGKTGTLIPKERAAKRNRKAISFRFKESVFEWFKDRDLKMQGVIERLVKEFIHEKQQEKETEEKKIQGCQK